MMFVLVINLKKWIIIVFLVSLFYLLAERKNNVLYINDTFRFRIIANSNSVEDQALKNKIKKDIVTNVFQKMDFNSSSSVKNEIKNNLPLISNIVSQYNIKYNISFGKNYFPEKSLNGIKLKKGNYDSLVINLGENKGDNWWCILFPPLCDLNSDEYEKPEYKFLISEVLKK